MRVSMWHSPCLWQAAPAGSSRLCYHRKALGKQLAHGNCSHQLPSCTMQLCVCFSYVFRAIARFARAHLLCLCGDLSTKTLGPVSLSRSSLPRTKDTAATASLIVIFILRQEPCPTNHSKEETRGAIRGACNFGRATSGRPLICESFEMEQDRQTRTSDRMTKTRLEGSCSLKLQMLH